MSQKKVDNYKQEKANREQIIKKEKRILALEKLAALIVGIAIVCWVGFSIYGKVTDGGASGKENTVINMDAVDNYVSGLTMEEEMGTVQMMDE